MQKKNKDEQNKKKYSKQQKKKHAINFFHQKPKEPNLRSIGLRLILQSKKHIVK